MKSKSFLVSIFLIIMTSTTFLLWYGETTITNKANIGYSVFSFLTSSNIIRGDDLSALDFKIENLEKNDIEYIVSISLNDGELISQKYTVKSKGSLNVEAYKDVLVKAIPNALNTYTITIKWGANGKNKETLKKQFKLSDETN